VLTTREPDQGLFPRAAALVDFRRHGRRFSTTGEHARMVVETACRLSTQGA
jgi:hypothetical protein